MSRRTALKFTLLAMLARAEDGSCAPDFSAAAGDAPVPACAAARYEAELARADRELRARFRWLQEERRFRGDAARMPPPPPPSGALPSSRAPPPALLVQLNKWGLYSDLAALSRVVVFALASNQTLCALADRHWPETYAPSRAFEAVKR